MARGRPIVACRVSQATMDAIDASIRALNDGNSPVAWDRASWLAAAVREKLAKMKRSRKARPARPGRTIVISEKDGAE